MAKGETVRVRVSVPQRELVRLAAESEGVSMSTFMRQASLALAVKRVVAAESEARRVAA